MLRSVAIIIAASLCFAALLISFSSPDNSGEDRATELLGHMPDYFRQRYAVEQALRKKLDAGTASLDLQQMRKMNAHKGSLSRQQRYKIAKELIDKETSKVAELYVHPVHLDKTPKVKKSVLQKEEEQEDKGLSALLTHAIIKKQKTEERNWLVSEDTIKKEKAKEISRLAETVNMWKKSELAAKKREAALKKQQQLLRIQLEKQNNNKKISPLSIKQGQKPNAKQVNMAEQLRAKILADSKSVTDAVKKVEEEADKLGLNKPIGEELAEKAKSLQPSGYFWNNHDE